MTEQIMLKPEKNNPKKIKAFTINALLHDPIDQSKKCIVDDIDAVIKKETNIKHFAWIVYDKGQENDSRPATIQLLLTLKDSRSVEYIAKLFGVDVKCVKEGLQYGNTVFPRFTPTILLYMLHVNAPEEYQYPIEELHTDTDTLGAYPDFMESYNRKHGEPSEQNSHKKPLEAMLDQIKDGRRLSEIREDPDLDYFTYTKYSGLLKQAEKESIFHDAVLPTFLLNTYIYGESGTDKTTFAKLIAKWLYKPEKHPYFTVVTQDDPFQYYLQEKVLLWRDANPDNLKKVAPNGEVLEMLDPFQKEKTARLIKKSHVILTNELNIFTSSIPYRKFFKDITPSDTSEKQVYRRFPLLIEIKPDEIVVLMNKAYYVGLMGGFSDDEKADWVKRTNMHDTSAGTLALYDTHRNLSEDQNDKDNALASLSDDIEEELAALMLFYDNNACEYTDICSYKVDIKRILSIASAEMAIRILEPFLKMLEYVVEKLRADTIKDEGERSIEISRALSSMDLDEAGNRILQKDKVIYF